MERRESARLDRLLEDAGLNAALSWLLTGVVALGALASLLGGRPLWGLFAGTVVALTLVPPVAYRTPTVMLPWEVLALAALPVVARIVPALAAFGDAATYLSVAALALVVAVELHVLTPVRMTAWFAVGFVVVTTMATAGVWAVVQWLSDVYLGTTFVLDPALSESEREARMLWDFVAATGAGVVAGVLFDRYFRRMARASERLPVDRDPDGEGGSGVEADSGAEE